MRNIKESLLNINRKLYLNLKLNLKVKLKLKLSMCLILTLLFAIYPYSFTSYAATRNKYTFTMTNGEKYSIIADDNGNGDYTVIGSAYNDIRGITNGLIVSGNSLYTVVTNDYENAYYVHSDSASVKSAKVSRGKDVLLLYELLVKGQKASNGEAIYAAILDGNDDDKVIVSATGNDNLQYGKNGLTQITQKSYKDIISTYAATLNQKNPYYKSGQTIRSEGIKFNDNKLSDYYTDEILIKAYENNSSSSSLSWIKKEETTESQVTVGNYRLLLDTVTDSHNIYLKVVDSVSNAEKASFLIAQKIGSQSTYSELTYANDNSNAVRWIADRNGQRIEKTRGGNSYNTSITFYYHKTIDGIVEKLDRYDGGTKIQLPSGIGFAALRNGISSSIDAYYITEDNGKFNATLIGTTSLDNLKDYLNAGALTTVSGNWLIEKTGSIAKIYRDTEEDVDANAIYLNFSKMFACFNNNNKYYDVAIPAVIGKDGQFENKLTPGEGKLIAFISTDSNISKNYETQDDCLRVFNNDYNDPFKKMYVNVIRQKNELSGKGTNKDSDKVKISEFDSSATDADKLPPAMPIKEILLTSDMQGVISSFVEAESQRISNSYTGVLADTTEISIEFIGTLIGYGKNILIIIIFIGIVIAGYRHMTQGAFSAEERAKTIERFKHIAFGVAIFITLTAFVALIIKYVDKGSSFIASYQESFGEGEFEIEDQIARKSLLLDIIEVIIRVVNEIMKGVIEFTAKSLAGSSAGIDYMELIYNCYDGGGEVSSMNPFSENGVEWTRCLSGYNVLFSLALIMMLFVIVKMAVEYVVYAGNQKKIVEIKETWYRIFWAVILLLVVPYMFQGLLYLFNYMTAAVPVNVADTRFDIDIAFDGVLGAIAENMFLTVKCNIYMTFLVRHVMLDLLLISAPIVIAAWAVSDKFRSFNIWLGEVISNIALQFCYAVGFLIIILLSFEGENPLYGLLLISVSVGLSKFIKESLQGYFQEWGGIDEEKAGASIVGRVFGWGRKAKKTAGTIGGLLEQAGDLMDPDGTSKGGTVLHNSGSVLQGRFGNIRLKSKRYGNFEKVAKSNKKEAEEDEKMVKEEYEEELELLPEDEQELAKIYKEDALKNAESANKYFERKEGGIYDRINEYADAHKRTVEEGQKVAAAADAKKKIEQQNPLLALTKSAEDKAMRQMEDEAGSFERVEDLPDDEEVKAQIIDDNINAVVKQVEEDGQPYDINEAYIEEFVNQVVDVDKERDSAGKMEGIERAMTELNALATSDALFTQGENKELVDAMSQILADRTAKACAAAGIEVNVDVIGDKYKEDINKIYSQNIDNASPMSSQMRSNKPDDLKYQGSQDPKGEIIKAIEQKTGAKIR